MAIAVGGEIRIAGQANKVSSHARLVEFFQSIQTPPLQQRRLPWKNVISTRSNLKSAVLREIVLTLGLDFSPFELKEKSVIDRLATLRNSVAHGHGQPIRETDYNLLHRETIVLLDVGQVQGSTARRAKKVKFSVQLFPEIAGHEEGFST